MIASDRPITAPRTADVVVIGAGVVGACCAHYLAEAGLNVVVVDRGLVASGTTGAGEGNILVSDKEIGAEIILFCGHGCFPVSLPAQASGASSIGS